MDPNYAHKTTKCFVCGGPSGQLESTIKGWFSSKAQIIHKDEGPIHALQWKGSLIAFATDYRVVITDARTMSPIAAISRDAGAPPPAQYRCCLVWESDRVLIMGWADQVTIVRLTEREIGGGRSQWHMETLHTFKTAFWICGIAPFGTDVVVLAYYDIEEDGEVARPELKILSRKTGEEHASDCLKVHGYERYAATDYRLDCLHEDSLYYVVAPKDVVVARQRDVDDHVSWLLQLAGEEAANPEDPGDAETTGVRLHIAPNPRTLPPPGCPDLFLFRFGFAGFRLGYSWTLNARSLPCPATHFYNLDCFTCLLCLGCLQALR